MKKLSLKDLNILVKAQKIAGKYNGYYSLSINHILENSLSYVKAKLMIKRIHELISD